MQFFEYIAERYSTLLRKRLGQLPITEDPVIRDWYFCNVYREDDKTTQWFKNNLRTKYGGKYDLFSTIVFRLFNLPATGQTLIENDLILSWDLELAVEEIKKQPQLISGAYILKGHNCGCKVRGLAMVAQDIWENLDYHYETMLGLETMESQYHHLMTVSYLGRFTAYQKMMDLKHTPISWAAPDKYSWCVAGPGAIRGLNRLAGREVRTRTTKIDYLKEIRDLQARSKSECYLPLDVTDIQHNLCEYDKYLRIVDGGKMKRKYQHKQRLRELF